MNIDRYFAENPWPWKWSGHSEICHDANGRPMGYLSNEIYTLANAYAALKAENERLADVAAIFITENAKLRKAIGHADRMRRSEFGAHLDYDAARKELP